MFYDLDECILEKIKNMNPDKYDLVILRNFANFNIKNVFKCPVYFFIPGVFTDNLNKYYYDITEQSEMDKYINLHIIQTINQCDKSFVNSQHTHDILKHFYDVETEVLYFGFIPYIDTYISKDIHFDERKYKNAIIVSDITRKIKNIKDYPDDTLFIGKGTDIGLIENKELEKYYKQIQNVIQDSYFESCSNVKIEASLNSCNVISTC